MNTFINDNRKILTASTYTTHNFTLPRGGFLKSVCIGMITSDIPVFLTGAYIQKTDNSGATFFIPNFRGWIRRHNQDFGYITWNGNMPIPPDFETKLYINFINWSTTTPTVEMAIGGER